ncbi:rhamnogalacturonan endolyase family protein [Streptomyces mirabilis]
MESLDRGLVAVPSGKGNFLSWRLLGTEYALPQVLGSARTGGTPTGDAIAFNVYKGGRRLNQAPVTRSTTYQDDSRGTGAHTVRAVVNGHERKPSSAALDFVRGSPRFRWPPPTDTPCNTPGPATSTATDATNSSSAGSRRPATSPTSWRRTRSPARGFGASTSARARTPRSAGTAPTTPRPPRSAARRRSAATATTTTSPCTTSTATARPRCWCTRPTGPPSRTARR